jgi:Tfp pilus assembly protein PilN
MRAVNLLPADLRGAVKAPVQVTPAAEDSGGSGAYFALGALALCVLAVAGYVLTTNTIKQREADLVSATARSAAVIAEVNRLKPFADFEQTANARIQTVRDLASQRFDWERTLGDLARVLPSDVTVKSLRGSLSAAAGSGNSPLRGAITAPAITIDGCTADQKAVARLMARLQTVSGVTRVSLAKSDKLSTTTADAGGSAATAAPTGCDTTGKSDPPDFQVVAFFERAAALSADAGAAPTAAPPAATPAADGTTPPAGTQPAATGTPTPDPSTASGTSTPVSTKQGAPE